MRAFLPVPYQQNRILFIQIMGDTMTGTTFGELIMHRLRMRSRPMTALAFRDGLMCILVTGGAGQGFMLGWILVEQI